MKKKKRGIVAGLALTGVLTSVAVLLWAAERFGVIDELLEEIGRRNEKGPFR